MPVTSFHNRDMRSEPLRVRELIEYLSEYPQGDELRFMGPNSELFFFRFKRRGEQLLTIELEEGPP